MSQSPRSQATGLRLLFQTMPENLSSIDKSNFENPKRDVKSKVMAENETKSNNFVSSN